VALVLLLCAMGGVAHHGWAYATAFHKVSRTRPPLRRPLVPFMLLNVIGNPRLMQTDSRAFRTPEGAARSPRSSGPYLERLLASGVGRPSTIQPSAMTGLVRPAC